MGEGKVMQRIRKAAQPGQSDVHVNRPLTNISVHYGQNASQYQAANIFPIVPVNKKSDLYYIYTRADFLRNEAKQRAPGTESAGGGYNLSTDSYLCHKFAYHKDVDDDTRANSDTPLRPDSDATEFVTQKMLLKRESDWLADFFASSKGWTDLASPPTAWSTSATANPMQDVQLGVRSIQSGTGFKPNTLVLGTAAWDSLRVVEQIVDRIKHTSSDSVTTATVARLFEIDDIIVLESVVNSAVEEIPSAESTDFAAGADKALLLYVNRTPGLMQPSAGYTFTWNGLLGSNANTGQRVKKFRMEEIESDRIEVEMAYDQKQVGGDLGYFINDVNTDA